MVFLVVALAAVVLGLVLGGRLNALAELRVRAVYLFYVAAALQVAAFPSGVFPWRTGDLTARVLWLASYACLGAAVAVNYRVRGALIVALGMFANLEAIIANRGHMPALPHALREAGIVSHVHNNSIAAAHPHLPWLVDRWVVPSWIPLGNVFSVGDVVIAVGAFVLVVAAMGVRLPSPARTRDSLVRTVG